MLIHGVGTGRVVHGVTAGDIAVRVMVLQWRIVEVVLVVGEREPVHGECARGGTEVERGVVGVEVVVGGEGRGLRMEEH